MGLYPGIVGTPGLCLHPRGLCMHPLGLCLHAPRLQRRDCLVRPRRSILEQRGQRLPEPVERGCRRHPRRPQRGRDPIPVAAQRLVRRARQRRRGPPSKPRKNPVGIERAFGRQRENVEPFQCRELARRQILLYTLLLVAVTLGAAVTGALGQLYLAGAAGLGGLFIALAVMNLRSLRQRWSRWLFDYSIAYLGLLFGVMVADRMIGRL